MPELPVFHAVRYLPYPLFLFHKDFGEALVIAIHHWRLSMDHRKTIRIRPVMARLDLFLPIPKA